MSENEKEIIQEQEQEEKTAKKKEKKSSETLELIEKLQAESNEYKDKWMRSVAEFDNYKKRNARIWQDAFNEGKAEVILKILPVGDNLDTAIGMITDEKTLDGIKLLKRKFEQTLQSLEVEEINPIGEKFDPMIAEAIMQVEPLEGEESDVVKQVFLKGYKTKDKIIRYAKVSVSK